MVGIDDYAEVQANTAGTGYRRTGADIPTDDCRDLRVRYGPISERAFEQVVQQARIQLWSGPARETGSGGEVNIAATPPRHGGDVARKQLSAGDIWEVFHGVRADVDWMRDRGLDADGRVANVAWLDASIRAEVATWKPWIVQALSGHDRKEAALAAFLNGLSREDTELERECRDWIEDFKDRHWRGERYDQLAYRLVEIGRDNEPTRPIQLGGRGRRFSPAAVVRSMNLRLGWIGYAVEILDLCWE